MSRLSTPYVPRQPQETVLYALVKEHLAAFLQHAGESYAGPLPKYVVDEFRSYLGCGDFARGFVHVQCTSCSEVMAVAFSCKLRGLCPSCGGRRMAGSAAHLVEDVLPVGAPLRQWVLTVPFAWRKRLGYDGPLLSALTRLFVKTVLDFYRERLGGAAHGQSGAVVAVQRTSSDLKLNPHGHAVFLDGVYRDKDGDELAFRALAHLTTRSRRADGARADARSDDEAPPSSGSSRRW